jgi:hypothetical protein
LDRMSSGLFWTDGTAGGSVPCSFCSTDPSECCDYPEAWANCPLSCGTCPPRDVCTNTCVVSGNGDCEDGGPGAEYSGYCGRGTDCNDCSAGVGAAAAATAAALACCGKPRRRRVTNRIPSPSPPAEAEGSAQLPGSPQVAWTQRAHQPPERPDDSPSLAPTPGS